jgi:hypothetical protein
VRARIITTDETETSRRTAAWHASQPTSSALLRLDRARHRQVVDDLLDRPRRVSILLVHGEVGQGHDHFGEVVAWRLRKGDRGRWRELEVPWPAPSHALGIRLAMVFEALADALAIDLRAPTADPSTPRGAQAWRDAMAPVLAAIDAQREQLRIRHVLRALDSGRGGDAAVVDGYLRAVWTQLAARAGRRIVVELDLRRTEHSGSVLSKAWWTSRADLATIRAITAVLDRLDMQHSGVCVTLPELTSIPVADLIEWLHLDGGRKRDAAKAEADALVSSTRGGRFELIVERLTALHLDHPRSLP